MKNLSKLYASASQPDWKKIAKARLEKIKSLQRQCDDLRTALASELERELLMQFHAHCFPRNAYESKLKAISQFVAGRVQPKIPK